jgi:type II secretory pathway component GspD/PulD (secretin)
MTSRMDSLSLLGGLLLFHSSGQAQEKSNATPPKKQRTLHTLKHGDAGNIAGIVSKHFKGEAEVSAVPGGSGNAVLISGSPGAVEEVVKLIGELDRAPKTVEVEVILAEIPAKKGDAKEGVDVDLSGPGALSKLESMAKAGQVGTMQRIKLTALEGQPIASSIGGNKPYTSALKRGAGGFGGGGPVQRSVTYQAVGTTVRLTTSVGAGDAVTVDLDLRDSQIKPPEAGDDAGGPTFENSTLTTKLKVPNGKSVVAQGVRAEAKSGRTATLVIVTARVVDPASADNKQ